MSGVVDQGSATGLRARRAVVVGAGPAGTLASILLAQQGWTVTLLEKRDRASSVGGTAKQRSWAIALCEPCHVTQPRAGLTPNMTRMDARPRPRSPSAHKSAHKSAHASSRMHRLCARSHD